MSEKPLACLDCGLLYRDFSLDMNLPNAQWLLIHPEGYGGVLCPNCICARAAKFTTATVVHAVFEIAPCSHAAEIVT